jgi:GT2 family glycosyltransferase
VSAVTAACLLTKRSIFQEVGGFDDTRLAIAYNDVDLCLKIGALGYRVLWTPWAELIHHESLSRGHDAADPRKRARFLKEQGWMRERWQSALEKDRSYNPNLSLRNGAFELCFPPRLPEV